MRADHLPNNSYDIICLDSKAFKQKPHYGLEDIIAKLKTLKKKCGRLIWLDNSDSAGTTEFGVLPYIDIYGKRQLYRDRSHYAKQLYGDRLYTDFYHHEYGIKDNIQNSKSLPLPPGEQHKLKLTWNFAFNDYRWHTRFDRILYGFSRMMWLPFRSISKPRNIRVFTRFSTSYALNTVAFQRSNIIKELRNSNLIGSSNRISHHQYMKEMRQAKAVISPFGWGEICLRDIETWLAGAALLKPDIGMIETWPDIYLPQITYLPLPWDINGMIEALRNYLANDKLLLSVAAQGQKYYRKLWQTSKKDFCEHFKNLLIR